MGVQPLRGFQASILDDFIGQNWQQFITFIEINFDLDEDDSEAEAGDIAQRLGRIANT